MLFNSLEFAVFLPLVFLLYWFVFKRSAGTQNLFLLLASYFFYAYWDWRCVGLIALTSFCTWASALLMERIRLFKALDTPPPIPHWLSSERLICGLNIVINLTILGFFKYYNFFVSEFSAIFLGGRNPGLALSLILPIGISFYTFSALSYSVDVFRKKIVAARSFIDVFAYLSFFPQLFAGPIGRASELIPQYSQRRQFDYAQAVDGLRQMLWGFFKKMVIADNCAKAVDAVWGDYSNCSGSVLLVAAILYSIQIYGDFSGYSDMAIGCAKLFGIKLSANFSFPYFSRSVAEFWRRWHISLNTWFRDYLYIPLGGSREGKWKTLRNTLIIFAVCGFWHGANWTFIVWGIFHGLLFAPRLLIGSPKESGVAAEERFFPSLSEILKMGTTFVLITIGWVFFRAPSIADAFSFFERMLFSGTLFSFPRGLEIPMITFVFIGGMFAMEWFNRREAHALARVPVKYTALRWLAYFVLGCVIMQYDGGAEQFIYFQF